MDHTVHDAADKGQCHMPKELQCFLMGWVPSAQPSGDFPTRVERSMTNIIPAGPLSKDRATQWLCLFFWFSLNFLCFHFLFHEYPKSYLHSSSWVYSRHMIILQSILKSTRQDQTQSFETDLQLPLPNFLNHVLDLCENSQYEL